MSEIGQLVVGVLTVVALSGCIADETDARREPPDRVSSIEIAPAARAGAATGAVAAPVAHLAAAGVAPSAPSLSAESIAAGRGETSAVLLAAGDVATCSSSGDEATALLLDSIAGVIAALGDLAYPDGSTREFADCYQPSWGRHNSRAYPTPGNHEYHQTGAAPYFAYFGTRAGEPGKGYYSYNVGAWHIIVLNSHVSTSSGSPQMVWLRDDLAASTAKCTLAYFHRPRFSSGYHGSSTSPQRFWQALYDAGADIILSAHDHHYERFSPQTPTGVLDNERGIRQWVVGTGGGGFTRLGAAQTNSEVRNNSTYGLLKLTLKPTSYEWEFVPIAGSAFTDSGSGVCH